MKITAIALISMVGTAVAREATPFPPINFDLLHIKTPQLIGIVAGCLVFCVTIGVVVYLLYQSGSLSKLMVEMQANQPLVIKKNVSSASPQFTAMPELYDHLLKAASDLPVKPTIDLLKGKLVHVREYNDAKDSVALFAACNGSALYHESAYDCARIWGWLDNKDTGVASTIVTPTWPGSSMAVFNNAYSESTLSDGRHLVIVDVELDRQIGMASLVDSDPRNLSIRIGTVSYHVTYTTITLNNG